MSTAFDFNRLLVGDCRAVMRSLPERSVQCAVTSPPYFGLRDYGLPPSEWANGWIGCYGLEPTPEQFIEHSVEVFREARRILRDDGTLWINLGDCYATGAGSARIPGRDSFGKANKVVDSGGFPVSQANRMPQPGLKPGDLCNMPHRVAAALQAEGWFWRSTICWHKKSPMPESISGWRWRPCRVKVPGSGWGGADGSVHPSKQLDGHTMRRANSGGVPKDGVAKFIPCPGCEKCLPNGGYVLRRGKWRPTTAHEYVFLFSKSERYFCDGDAVQESASTAGQRIKMADGWDTGDGAHGTIHRNGREKGQQTGAVQKETRNPRSVWTLSSEPFKGAHFATFPTLLARKCIEAGTSAGGCCPTCEAPLAPVVSSERVATRPAIDPKAWKHQSADQLTQRSSTSPNLDPQRHIAITQVNGYRPTCSCPPAEPVGCVVFDPFAGSGTTLQVARALGRRWLGSELSEEYAALARQRIATPPRWAQQETKSKTTAPAPGQRELF